MSTAIYRFSSFSGGAAVADAATEAVRSLGGTAQVHPASQAWSAEFADVRLEYLEQHRERLMRAIVARTGETPRLRKISVDTPWDEHRWAV